MFVRRLNHRISSSATRGFTFLIAVLVAVGLTACTDSMPTQTEPEMAVNASSTTGDIAESAKREADSDLQQELAALREATSQYQDVKKAEADGYVQASPFVHEMGFHYVKGPLVPDGQVDVDNPEALVYDSNDPDQETRNLGAVEYIIPDPGDDHTADRSGDNLPTPFATMTTDDWHYESHLDSWTLHVWIWLDNPKGVFHPHNPRVELDA